MLRDVVSGGEPVAAGLSWPDSLAEIGRTLRQMLLGYRDGANLFSGTYLTDQTLLTAMEFPLRKLTDAGFSVRDAIRGYFTVYSYTIGFTIEEQAVFPRPGERRPQYDLAKRAERIDPDEFPLTAAAGEEIFAGYDERFEHGLQLIIAGLEHSLHRH